MTLQLRFWRQRGARLSFDWVNWGRVVGFVDKGPDGAVRKRSERGVGGTGVGVGCDRD